VGKGCGQGFLFSNLWDRKSGELFQKFNKISRMYTTEKKNPKFRDTFAKNARNFIRKESLDGV
jgi:hypothetical protein